MNLVPHTFPQRLSPDVLSAPSSQESSQKQHLQHEAVSQLQSPVGFSDDKESSTTNVVEAQLEQKQLNSNIADQYRETSSTKPVLQAVNIIQLQRIDKKPASESTFVKQPQRVTGTVEMVKSLSSEKINVLTNSPTQNNLEDDSLQYSEKKAPPRRTPSNVRKMISAFESVPPKDIRSPIKPPPTKYQASPIEKKDSSETQHLEQDKSLNTEPRAFLQERLKSATLVRNLQQVPVQIGESKEKIKDTMQLELSTKNIPNKQTDSNARNEDQDDESNSKVRNSRDQEKERNNRILTRTSTCETINVSGKVPLKLSERNTPNNLSQDAKCLSHERSLDFTKIENVDKNVPYTETGTEVSKYEKLQDIEESKTNTSTDDKGDENSGGPFDQVIKVAIVIGFGLLVLFTRQRKKRRKENSA